MLSMKKKPLAKSRSKHPLWTVEPLKNSPSELFFERRALLIQVAANFRADELGAARSVSKRFIR